MINMERPTGSTKMDGDVCSLAFTLKADAVDMLLASINVDASALRQNKRIKNN
jgi:hypothetical protein